MSVKGVAILRGENGIHGVINFEQPATGGNTTIKGKVSGLAPGLHGFHIHAFGDLSNGCVTAGPHFNPTNATHGGPKDEVRHFGDLGNVEVTNQGDDAVISLNDHLLSLIGEHSIIGRSVIMHAKEDDLGRGGDEESKKTGNAGARLCCGVIGLAASS